MTYGPNLRNPDILAPNISVRNQPSRGIAQRDAKSRPIGVKRQELAAVRPAADFCFSNNCDMLEIWPFRHLSPCVHLFGSCCSPIMTDLLRQEIATEASTIVVKVGTRVLTHSDGRLDEARIADLADQVNQLILSGRKVVLVSSGAVASGMGRLGLHRRPDDLPHLQAVAAIGQSVLVEAYERSLWAHGYHAAQVLLTADDLNHRPRYLNARNTLLTLLELGAVPIINENDTVAVDELQTTFGDNDRLAAMVTNLIQAPLLVLLSDVDGLYDGDPSAAGSHVIPTVSRLTRSIFGLVRDRLGGLSKGGMTSKLEAARLVTGGGENVIITAGHTPNVLVRIIAGEPIGTLFLAQGQAVAARKRWIGFTVQPRGRLILDAGARKAVECQGRSLLAIGVLEVEGRFSKGDVIGLRDLEGAEFARGLTNYSADEVRRIKGLKTGQIAETLGQCPYDEVIHRDNMVITSTKQEPAAEES
jgi:glutamate 5-kinase